MKISSRLFAQEITAIILGFSLAPGLLAADLFLIGERAGYAITRKQGEACFAIAPSSVAAQGVDLHAMRPETFRLPATVVLTLDAGIAIIRVGEDAEACKNAAWSDGENLETALGRTGIGTLQIRIGDDSLRNMHVRVEQLEPAGYFTVSTVASSDKLMRDMVGSRVLLEDAAAGMLLEVDEAGNRGTVIRQDRLDSLVAPFFDSIKDALVASDASSDAGSMAADTTETNSINTDSTDSGLIDIESVDTDLTITVQAPPRPEIIHRFFIGRQTWRNNPLIIGNRLFVGSSGSEWNKPDELDGAYSFDLDTGEQVWFVHTDNDFNDLTYIDGFIVGGTDSGEVLGIGARSGKTYWTRNFDGKVYARPVQLPSGVAIATSIGELFVLDLKDGIARASSRLDAGVRAGLVAAQGDLWVATESGTLYRYVGFGDVQMRRRSRIFYPDPLGKNLSGAAIDWYDRLGQGRGRRAKFYGTPVVLGDRIILTLVRQEYYEYPPVMAFLKDGGLDWIGTDPDGFINSTFGNSRLTPASWHDQLILADPFSNAIYSLSLESGQVLWATELGYPAFQQWASPVVENDYVYVARHDGFLHKLQAKDGKRIWSMYLGQEAHAGQVFVDNEPLPDMRTDSIWNVRLASPVFSTPAVSKGTIVVGTDEGYLYVIHDPQ